MKLAILSVLFSMLAFYIFCETNENNETTPGLVTYLEDEMEMRERIREQAIQKLSLKYHKDPCQVVGIENCRAAKYLRTLKIKWKRKVHLNCIKRRRKRDPSAALFSGIIGMTAKVVSELTCFNSLPTNGGCQWFGLSPFCRRHCPSEYDYIRSSNGRCSNFWLAKNCIPDHSFGDGCATLFGAFFKKRFCCKSDPRECTWAGRWMGANTAYNAYCRYDNGVEPCGQLSCSINHYDYKAIDRAPIEGKYCDQVKLFNLSGTATCGYIRWLDANNNEVVNSWYKTGAN